MEENISKYDLLDIAKNKIPISNFIITDEDFISVYKDSGDIIVYTNNEDGSPLTTNDSEGQSYTDLYIGDEHVAGGFGFVNTSQRSYVIDSAYNKIPEIIERIDSIQDRFDEDGYSPEINIDSSYRYITTEDAIYTLKYELTYLKFDVNYKENVPEFSIDINGETISNNSHSYICRICEDINISRIRFTTKSNDNLTGFWISYVIENDNETTVLPNNDFNIYGSSDNPIEINNCTDFMITMFNDIDPNIKPQVNINKYELIPDGETFKDKINSLPKTKNLKFYLHLRFNIENEKEIEILNIDFIDPIYYCIANENNEIPQENEMNMLLWRYNEDVEIDFIDKDNSVQKYYYVLIPNSITNIKFIQKSNNVIFDWKQHNDTIKEHYTCYSSPCPYKGSKDGNPITWVLKISN